MRSNDFSDLHNYKITAGVGLQQGMHGGLVLKIETLIIDKTAKVPGADPGI